MYIFKGGSDISIKGGEPNFFEKKIRFLTKKVFFFMAAKHYQVLIIYIYTAYISLAFNKYVNVRSPLVTHVVLL
jgi:hypothetical protein